MDPKALVQRFVSGIDERWTSTYKIRLKKSDSYFSCGFIFDFVPLRSILYTVYSIKYELFYMIHIIWISDPRRQRRSGRESYLMAHSSFFFDIASFPTRQIINGRIIWLWDYWFRNWGEYWYREQKLEQKRGRSESGRSWGKVDGPTGCKWTVQSPKSGRSWVKVDAPKGNPLSTDRPLSGPFTFPRLQKRSVQNFD